MVCAFLKSHTRAIAILLSALYVIISLILSEWKVMKYVPRLIKTIFCARLTKCSQILVDNQWNKNTCRTASNRKLKAFLPSCLHILAKPQIFLASSGDGWIR